MISALAAIDRELGLPDDGCNSTAQTLNAIRLLKLAHRDDVKAATALEKAVTALECERGVLLGLLTDCAAVLRTIDPDDSDEAEKLTDLLGEIDSAQAPIRHQGILECPHCSYQWTVPCSFDEDYS